MGIKIILRQSEPIALALRRLRKLIDREKPRLFVGGRDIT
jgi:ribosomal protein S21